MLMNRPGSGAGVSRAACSCAPRQARARSKPLRLFITESRRSSTAIRWRSLCEELVAELVADSCRQVWQAAVAGAAGALWVGSV